MACNSYSVTPSHRSPVKSMSAKQVRSKPECIFSCQHTENCSSINYGQNSSNTMYCELFDSQSVKSANLSWSPDWTFMSKYNVSYTIYKI